MKKVEQWRWIFYIIGMFVMALGITMTIKGRWLGVGPWDVFHIGLQNHFGLTIGTWSILTGLGIILLTSLAVKQFPQIGTWLNMLLLGLFIDFFNWLLPEFTTWIGQISVFILGILVMSYGIGLYVAPNMGAGPRDSLMLLFVKKWGISIKVVRTAIEIIVAIAGWLLGGPVGIGTVLIALFIGQVVHITLPQSQQLLIRMIGEQNRHYLQ